MNVAKYYDKLIDENNDPVHDPKPLKDYMDKWDGQLFIDELYLDTTKSVLEIGVGTGCLAVKTAPLCKSFYGIDISPKTIERARRNLSEYSNVELICGNFSNYKFNTCFDVIYSSLTFMHIKEKQKCITKAVSLLKQNGLFVLSIDKNQNDFIDLGSRKIQVYPDEPTKMQSYIENAGLKLLKIQETEFAYILKCIKL